MKLLYPLAVIYGLLVYLRNKLFDFGILKQKSFNIPIISIGNISLGGTGKTPHIEYFINKYKDSRKIAVISRGYGRKSKGFHYVNFNDDASNTGDEPLQVKYKFPEITVAVCEKRNIAAKQILSDYPQTDLILLDDGFQHRYINRSLNILLTPYQKPFWKDCVVPCGTLREFKNGYKRADIIIITKCPTIKTLKLPVHLLNKTLLFSEIMYDNPKIHKGRFSKKIVLVTGIANDTLFIDYLKNEHYEILYHFKFADHYNYLQTDIDKINKKVLDNQNSMIMTTEKDFFRLKNYYSNSLVSFSYIPIKIKLNKEIDWLSLCNTARH